jgi:hypothetical protein
MLPIKPEYAYELRNSGQRPRPGPAVASVCLSSSAVTCRGLGGNPGERDPRGHLLHRALTFDNADETVGSRRASAAVSSTSADAAPVNPELHRFFAAIGRRHRLLSGAGGCRRIAC